MGLLVVGEEFFSTIIKGFFPFPRIVRRGIVFPLDVILVLLPSVIVSMAGDGFHDKTIFAFDSLRGRSRVVRTMRIVLTIGR